MSVPEHIYGYARGKREREVLKSSSAYLIGNKLFPPISCLAAEIKRDSIAMEHGNKASPRVDLQNASARKCSPWNIEKNIYSSNF